MTDPCVHEDRWQRHERLLHRFSSTRHAIFEWMVISAAVAVLILVFHIYTHMSRVAVATQHMDKIMEAQNQILEEIHNAIHEEGRRNTEDRKAVCGSPQKGTK
jgi:uncharacterized membrane protein YukC